MVDMVTGHANIYMFYEIKIPTLLIGGVVSKQWKMECPLSHAAIYVYFLLFPCP